MTADPTDPPARRHVAGAVSRIGAAVVDLALVTVAGAVVVVVVAAARDVVLGAPASSPSWPGWALGAGQSALAVAYLSVWWSITGRSIGQQFFGLRVVCRTGAPLGPMRALVRAVAYVVFPIGLLWVLVSRRNASVQDLILRTAVVYDRTYRPPADHPADHPARVKRVSGPASEG